MQAARATRGSTPPCSGRVVGESIRDCGGGERGERQVQGSLRTGVNSRFKTALYLLLTWTCGRLWPQNGQAHLPGLLGLNGIVCFFLHSSTLLPSSQVPSPPPSWRAGMAPASLPATCVCPVQVPCSMGEWGTPSRLWGDRSSGKGLFVNTESAGSGQGGPGRSEGTGRCF